MPSTTTTMSTIVRDATTTLQERLKPRVPFRVVITIDFLGQTLPGKLATRAGTLTLRIVDTSIGYVRSTFPVKWLEGVILPKAAAATVRLPETPNPPETRAL